MLPAPSGDRERVTLLFEDGLPGPTQWLEDAVFICPDGGIPLVEGAPMGKLRDSLTEKHGWSEVRLDEVPGGCFHQVESGSCVRTAKYAWISHGRIRVFGPSTGAPYREVPPRFRSYCDFLPTLGPRRREWTGELGGRNYHPAKLEETLAAIRWVREERCPGAIILDGSDDWEAPLFVRPEVLVERYRIEPIAWWHTGMSGQTKSGVVLRPDQYDRLRALYADDFGFDIEAVPGTAAPSLVRAPCGCWAQQGVALYR